LLKYSPHLKGVLQWGEDLKRTSKNERQALKHCEATPPVRLLFSRRDAAVNDKLGHHDKHRVKEIQSNRKNEINPEQVKLQE
jgi:hypothetical protein